MVIKLVCVCTGVCRVSEPPVSPQGLPACTAPNRSQCRRGDDSDVGPPPLMAGADDGVPEHEVRSGSSSRLGAPRRARNAVAPEQRGGRHAGAAHQPGPLRGRHRRLRAGHRKTGPRPPRPAAAVRRNRRRAALIPPAGCGPCEGLVSRTRAARRRLARGPVARLWSEWRLMARNTLHPADRSFTSGREELHIRRSGVPHPASGVPGPAEAIAGWASRLVSRGCPGAQSRPPR